MVTENVARLVISFLVDVGFAAPIDVGVCALGDSDGRRAWRVLDELRKEGYVAKPRRARYEGDRMLAAKQTELF